MESFFSTSWKSELADRFDTYGDAKMRVVRLHRSVLRTLRRSDRQLRCASLPRSVLRHLNVSARTKRVWILWKRRQALANFPQSSRTHYLFQCRYSKNSDNEERLNSTKPSTESDHAHWRRSRFVLERLIEVSRSRLSTLKSDGFTHVRRRHEQTFSAVSILRLGGYSWEDVVRCGGDATYSEDLSDEYRLRRLARDQSC